MNNEDWYKEFKEIISKKPLLTLSEKCKTCKQKHPELNKRCDYIYCNKEDWYKKIRRHFICLILL